MKILHITNCLSEGGVESFLLSFLPLLKEKGHEVELLVLNKKSISLKTTFEKNGIKVYIGKYSNIYNPLNIFLLKRYFSHYDIIHTHLWPTQLFVSIAKKLCLTKAKFVTTEHNNFNKRRTYKWYRFIEQWMYKQFDVIIGVCEASRINLLKWIKHPRIISIPNGITGNKFEKAKPYSKEELGLPFDSFMIVMTARFFAQKDHQTLIKAMLYLPPIIHVVFVGSGEMMTECKKLAIELQVADRVHFLGNRLDVDRILKTANLCVLSTHYEGLPISIIEYMATGKAVVATKVDGVKDLLLDTCLVEPDDAQDMAFKIKDLYENKRFIQELEKWNLSESSKYNIENMVNQYEHIYKRVHNE